MTNNQKEVLDAFRKYLSETNPEMLEQQIQRIREMNFPGPTIDEYFKQLGNMNIIEAPFTQEQVDKINEYQQHPKYHPFTCCSPEEIEECLRANKQGKTFEENEGLLIATTDGFVCPCGKYTQDWCYEFMAK